MQYKHVKLLPGLFEVIYLQLHKKCLLDGNVHQASIIFVVYSTVLYAQT